MQDQAKMLQLILASGSPRRRELIALWNIPFSVVCPVYKELSTATDPDDFLKEICKQKMQVATSMSIQKDCTCFIVADTIVSVDAQILGKPSNINMAKDYLTKLSNKKHQVKTGVSIQLSYQGDIYQRSLLVTTDVYFSAVDPYLLDCYLQTEDWKDKAGGYGIQGCASIFVEKIVGSYSNVVGFPLVETHKALKDILHSCGYQKPWYHAFGKGGV